MPFGLTGQVSEAAYHTVREFANGCEARPLDWAPRFAIGGWAKRRIVNCDASPVADTMIPAHPMRERLSTYINNKREGLTPVERSRRPRAERARCCKSGDLGGGEAP